MSWLTDLLKHLSLSKSFTGALFVTSLALLTGPRIAPQYFDAVPAQWRWLVIAACIFSFVLLATWAVPPLVKGTLKAPSRVRNSLRFNPPTEQERAFIYFLGLNHPNDSCNLDHLNHSKISKLELIQLCGSLQRKGLVRVNEYMDDLVSLTDSGRSYALELVKQQPKT